MRAYNYYGNYMGLFPNESESSFWYKYVKFKKWNKNYWMAVKSRNNFEWFFVQCYLIVI